MSHFFAYLSRMKLIERWALMHNMRKENVQEHSLQVAMIAHALAVIKNKYYSGNLNPERVALIGIFHDASEVMTGDMPTPVKYFNPEIREVYKAIEETAVDKLVSILPEELRSDYRKVLSFTEEESEHWKIVKASDTLCAYIKCLEEGAAGNREFNHAKQSIEEKLQKMKMPEVDYFMNNFVKSFSLSLDELNF